MSVPSHNLYDFVHQLTEKQFWLLTFNPWGARTLKDLGDYQVDLDGPNGIPKNLRTADQLFPGDTLQLPHHIRIRQFQPILLCHDQEPLNFDLHKDTDCFAEEYQCPNFNLRTKVPTSWQEKWILLHSEKNSAELDKYINTGDFVGAYWWSHAMIARDWYRYAQHDQSLQHQIPNKLFLIYSRDATGTRQYRADFISMIESLGTNCQIGSIHEQHITANHSAVYHAEDFNYTAISIVLETLFDDPRIHLTEKILRPIACGHPFILAAGAGSLSLLKQYGFETFSPWIDESYDSITNSQDRLTAIVAEMRRISELSPNDLIQVIEQCRAVAVRNQKRFFSQDFFDVVATELKENVKQAWNTYQGKLSPDFYWQSIRWRRRHCPEWFTPDKQHNLSITLPMVRKLRRST